MPNKKTLRTIEDLRRVIRALGFEFKTDIVFIVGCPYRKPNPAGG